MASIPTADAGVPLRFWIAFHVGLVLLLAAELVYARRQARLGRRPRVTATVASAAWLAAALGFALYLDHLLGGAAAMQYMAGYAVEQSLSIDNLFVFVLLFRVFGVDRARQPRVLFWGVAGAILLRGLFIAGGLALLSRFEFVSYLFGVVLLVAAVRLLKPEEPSPSEPGKQPRWIRWLQRVHPISLRQDRFFVRENGRPMMTVLFLSLIAIELTDVVFALDSIPAVLSITRHPFLAYTSNIMAVMGLRSLYLILAAMLARLRYLHLGLALILGFAAFKMLGARWIEIGPVLSLGIIVILLAGTVVASLLRPASAPTSQPAP